MGKYHRSQRLQTQQGNRQKYQRLPQSLLRIETQNAFMKEPKKQTSAKNGSECKTVTR